MKRDYNISNEELSKLVSNYSITEIIDGKVKGKGSSKIRVLQNRKRAIEEKIKQGNFSQLDLAYVNYEIEKKSKTRYWQNKFADENSLFKKQDVDSLDKFLENTINEYLTPKVVPITKLAPNLFSEAAGSTKKVLGGIVIAGLLFAGGYLLGKHSDPKQLTAQVSGSYSPIRNAYAEPVASDPAKEQIVNFSDAVQEQEAESAKTEFIKVEPYQKPNVNYTHETNKKSTLERRLELARLNHDDFTVSKYQKQLKNLESPTEETKKEISKDKSKTKNWFIKYVEDIDDWGKDLLSPFRFDKLFFKGEEGKKEYFRKFLIFGKDSYHHQHPFKSIRYDLSAYGIGNGISNVVNGSKVSAEALIGEGRGGLGEN